MKAMMTAMMTAAIKPCLFIFLPSACLGGLGLLWLGSQGAPSPERAGGNLAVVPRLQSWGTPGPSLYVGLPEGAPQFLENVTSPSGV